MLIDITQTTRIGREYRTGSPSLKVNHIECHSGNHTYKTIEFSCATHNMGTHIDMCGIDIPLETERLIGEGIKFDVSHIIDRPVMLTDLDLNLVKKGAYVFFQTNWNKYFEDEQKYHAHPEIHLEVVEYLASRGVNMIGIDTLGVGRGKNHGTIDVYLAKEKCFAIENLCNLDKIPTSGFKVYNLPTKIEGLDVYPTRILVEF